VKSIAILGAGISGLCTAYYLIKQNPGLQLTIFDGRERPGGVIKTEKVDGFIIEGGPDSFLTQKKAATELCIELGLQDQLEGSQDFQRKTFIFHEGRLKSFPEGMFMMVPTAPLEFMKSDLISWSGKFSAMKDLFSVPERNDLSVADWVEKRFGLEVLHQIAEPLMAGVYGADPRNLSLQSALPQIWQLQQQGSLIRRGGPSAQSSKQSLFTTLTYGMQTLTDSLYVLFGHEFVPACKIDHVEKRDGKWWIRDRDYDAVVLASSTAPQIDSPYGEEIQTGLNSIHRNSAIVIVLAFKNVQREGFGWLVPASERKFALACTYINNKFANRSPADHLLVRLFVGGHQAGKWMNQSDEQIVDMALMDLKRISQISEAPILNRVFRWPNSMPEYAVGHQNKMEQLKKLARAEASLFLSGNILRGVGMPDCIAQAKETASLCLGGRDV
jgi:protoporphyrinogen/coproporphyrinogen III oxidase